jgi:hypothetical protein
MQRVMLPRVLSGIGLLHLIDSDSVQIVCRYRYQSTLQHHYDDQPLQVTLNAAAPHAALTMALCAVVLAL